MSRTAPRGRTMTELTQLQRARHLVQNLEPRDEGGDFYIYLYLGEATYDATQYEVIDGKVFSSKRIWHLDESKPEHVAYVGKGNNGRINATQHHSVYPSSPDLRLKLCEGLSEADAVDVERLLIAELGCLLDADRSDGCLANIRHHDRGPNCCPHLEAAAHQQRKIARKASVARAVDVLAMNADKTVVARGSARGLARQFGFNVSNISECCQNKRPGVWSKSRKQAIYFCYANQYEKYTIKPMTSKSPNTHRILIAQKIDGSDICCGTASEISRYAPEIKHSANLHRVARGGRLHAYGWTARYADELDDALDAITLPMGCLY